MVKIGLQREIFQNKMRRIPTSNSMKYKSPKGEESKFREITQKRVSLPTSKSQTANGQFQNPTCPPNKKELREGEVSSDNEITTMRVQTTYFTFS